MGDCVLRHCPSPITAIVYTKYFAKTMAVIGEGQCRNTQSPITDPPDPPLPLTLPGQTSRICNVFMFHVSGGMLGLFTGMSILSMAEVAFWIFKYLVNTRRCIQKQKT